MYQLPVLESYRSELSDSLAAMMPGSVPQFAPLAISPWLAMSLAQKAIRRGREETALRAAATLLNGTPGRLWRRLCVTVYEDIGIADLSLVGLVTAALKGKSWRSEVGGDWKVASYLVRRMVNARKCRAVDDLLTACEWQQELDEVRLALSFKPVDELIRIGTGTASLPERALALWFAVGTTRCWSPALRQRNGEPATVFDRLLDFGFPATLVEVCREGYRQSGSILCALLPLIWEAAKGVQFFVREDDLPCEVEIAGVPGWAFDMHVREGNRAFKAFLDTRCETSRWAHEQIPQGRVRAVGGMVFRAEGGLVDRRFRWGAGDDLLRIVDQECPLVRGFDAAEGLALLRHDVPVLNDVRLKILGSNSR